MNFCARCHIHHTMPECPRCPAWEDTATEYYLWLIPEEAQQIQSILQAFWDPDECSMNCPTCGRRGVSNPILRKGDKS